MQTTTHEEKAIRIQRIKPNTIKLLIRYAKLDESIEKTIDLTKGDEISKDDVFTNVFQQFLPYTFPGIQNPYLLSYIIKNRKQAKKDKNCLFTFVLYHYQSVALSQYKAANLQAAFAQWQKKRIASHTDVMPPRVLKRFKTAMTQQAKVNPLSPVLHHPHVWRWHFIAGESPCTLYIIETDSEPSSTSDNYPIVSATSSQDPYTQASKLMDEEEPDKKKVVQLLQKAVEATDPRAYYALASWYLHGESSLQKDSKKAIPLLEKAAEANVTEAAYDLAICYEEGKGVPKNAQRAYQLLLQAALLGDKDAVNEIARMYYYGIGTKEDKELADIFYQHAKKSR